MNIRLLSGIAAGCAAGFLGGWFLHPSAETPHPNDNASAKKIAKLEADLKTRTADLDRLTVAAQKETADKKVKEDEMKKFAPGGEEMKKMQDRMKRKMAEKQKLKLDEKMAVLRTRLKLTDAQAATIRELLEKNPEGMQSFMAKAMSGDKTDEKEAMLAMLRPGQKSAELTGKISALLTPEQQQAYTTFRQEQRSNDVEVKANKELARLQSSLTLNPEQKDKAFAALTKLADEEFDNPVSPMAAMLQQQMKMMPDRDPELKQHAEEINAAADFTAQRRQARVEAMREVLTPEQLALYQSQQKQGNMAEMLEGTFDDMPGNMFLGAPDEGDEPPSANDAGASPPPPKPVR